MPSTVTARRLVAAACRLLFWASVPGLAAGAALAADERFPEPSPATLGEAVELLRGEGPGAPRSLSAAIAEARRGPVADGGVQRALALLEHPDRAVRVDPGATRTVGSVTVRVAVPGTELAGSEADARTSRLIRAAVIGIEHARRLLVERAGFADPGAIEVLLAELGQGVEGYARVPPGGREDASAVTIVLDATPLDDPADVRRAAAREFARAVALRCGSDLGSGWSDALALWTSIELDGTTDPAVVPTLSRGIARLDRGLLAPGPARGAAAALWLAFVSESYGAEAVRRTVEHLAKGGPEGEALDRALEGGLAAAFREFHVWTMLTGERSTGRHFRFAGELPPAPFASTVDGLPALSVRADPPVGALGAAAVQLDPGHDRGGLTLRFEGEFPARWEADLLLHERRGVLRRVPLALSPAGSGEITVPLDGIGRAWLLVRNLGGDDPAAKRYTYSAHVERGFPFELARLEVREARGGVFVEWETASERDLLGFNLLRSRTGGAATRVNPVWVPALGTTGAPTSYGFYDPTAEPEVTYTYRVEGITVDGLASLSDSLTFTVPAAPATRGEGP